MRTFEISFRRLVTENYEVIAVTSHTMTLQATNFDTAKGAFKQYAREINRICGDIFQIESVKIK